MGLKGQGYKIELRDKGRFDTECQSDKIIKAVKQLIEFNKMNLQELVDKKNKLEFEYQNIELHVKQK